jgi:hypothetical protein
MKNILTGIQIVTNYPYGRLQCEMRFSIEFVKGKGYRSVMQSTNPKTGRLNKPKKSTYVHFMFMYKEETTGHIKFYELNFFGYDDINKFINVLNENEFQFSDEESQELFAWIITSLRGNAMYTPMKEGFTSKQLLEVLKVKEFIHLYKIHADINEIKHIGFNLDSIKEISN